MDVTVKEFLNLIDLETINGQWIGIIIPIEEKEGLKNQPLELREEKSDILLSVEPSGEKAVVSYNPIVENSPKGQSDKPVQKNILNHLQILSRISGKPEFGRVVVHIDEVLLDGTGVTDLPDKVLLMYSPNLRIGWAVVEGTLQDDKMKVSGIQFCEKEWCTDVS